ncbi:hypothetical protein ACLK19_00665 [Escherichia coli]
MVPFFKDVMPQLGLFYISAGLLRHCGYWQRGEPDDGLDGLAIMPTVFVAGVLRWWRGRPAI